jgi:hypothetical protein
MQFGEGNFSGARVCELLPETKHAVVLTSMHSFNPKSMKITLSETRNIPGTLIFKFNSESKNRMTGEGALNYG